MAIKVYFFVKVVKPIFLPSILSDEQCKLVLSKINIEPNSHSYTNSISKP